MDLIEWTLFIPFYTSLLIFNSPFWTYIKKNLIVALEILSLSADSHLKNRISFISDYVESICNIPNKSLVINEYNI